MIRERLGEFPLVGFFGNGEFAPIGRRNFFHNYLSAHSTSVTPSPSKSTGALSASRAPGRSGRRRADRR